jgi:Ca2+-binding RTX toxin-like protein
LDTNNLETVNWSASGGADAITLGDLGATSVSQVNLDLGANSSGAGGDSQIDTVTVNGTNDADQVRLSASGTGYVVAGLSMFVTVANSEANRDNLVVNLQGGDDLIDASALPAGVTNLSVDGGDGNDTILGSQGSDTLAGGDGNDFIDGGPGNDVVTMGAGDDTFRWDPGDGSDSVDGQSGHDTMRFSGSSADELIDVSASGDHVLFSRSVGNVTMDLIGVETVKFNDLGGADSIIVNDLTGTDLTQLNVNLAVPAGSDPAAGQAQSVIVNGTDGNDSVTVAGDAASTSVSGLSAQVTITGAGIATAELDVQTLGGNDTVDASGLSADAIPFAAFGGAGDDVLTGGAGDDVLSGDDGNDTLNGGPGDDDLFGGAGNDDLFGGPGTDELNGGPGNNVLIQD